MKSNEWIIQGIIPTECRTLLLGGTSSGKSWFLESLAISLASGMKLFGHFEVEKSQVILIDESTPTIELTRRLTLIDNRYSTFTNLKIHSMKGIRLNEKESLNRLLAEIESTPKPVVVLIDSLDTACTAKTNSYTEVWKMSSSWKDITKTATLVVTHLMTNPKTRGIDYDFTRYSYGSTYITVACDFALGIWKVSDSPTGFRIRTGNRRLTDGAFPFSVEMIDNKNAIVLQAKL